MGRLSGEPTVEAVAVQGGLLWTASRGSGVPFVLAHGGPGRSDNLALWRRWSRTSRGLLSRSGIPLDPGRLRIGPMLRIGSSCGACVT